MKTKDKYDRAIARITERCESQRSIWEARADIKLTDDQGRRLVADILHSIWNEGGSLRATDSILFDMASRTRDYPCGCLTQVSDRASGYIAATAALTDAIRADEAVPSKPTELTLADLPVFADWQRRLDREIPGRRQP